MHSKRGRFELATVVDHIIPHRGDLGLFWDEENWQSLCGTCHNSAKHRQELAGRDYHSDFGADGLPLDPKHPWNE